MRCLTAVITHLEASAVDAQMVYLHELAPGSRFLVCHGGPRAEYEALSSRPAIFLEDPALRAPIEDERRAGLSYSELMRKVYSQVRSDASIDFIYFIEYDQLILRGDFEAELVAMRERSGADFIAKNCVERNDTNWWWHLEYRNDPAVNRYFAGISRRDDHRRRFGCLGSGMLMTRRALEGLAALNEPPPCYVELFVPTAIYHLGFEVDDFDRLGDLYATVRWRPPYTPEEAMRAKRQARYFLHPFKETALLQRIREAPGPS